MDDRPAPSRCAAARCSTSYMVTAFWNSSSDSEVDDLVPAGAEPLQGLQGLVGLVEDGPDGIHDVADVAHVDRDHVAGRRDGDGTERRSAWPRARPCGAGCRSPGTSMLASGMSCTLACRMWLPSASSRMAPSILAQLVEDHRLAAATSMSMPPEIIGAIFSSSAKTSSAPVPGLDDVVDGVAEQRTRRDHLQSLDQPVVLAAGRVNHCVLLAAVARCLTASAMSLHRFHPQLRRHRLRPSRTPPRCGSARGCAANPRRASSWIRLSP